MAYEAHVDPYCYPGTPVLRNMLGLRSAEELAEFEAAITAQRAEEPLPAGELDRSHYLSIHRHLFQDVFDWAGRIRTVRVTKGSSTFCYPENIEAELERLFAAMAQRDFLRGMDAPVFAQAVAHVLAELNAIHPFREGNGRTQNVFLAMLADRAGHPLDFERLDPPRMLDAMIKSFHGDEEPLRSLILDLMRTG